jgi:hypothetical protein
MMARSCPTLDGYGEAFGIPDARGSTRLHDGGVTMMRRIALLNSLALTVALALGLLSVTSVASQQPRAARPNIVAQTLVEEVASKHSDITAMEIALRTPGKCSTVADTELEGIGEKCDHDELEAMKTGEPLVEKEADGFDVTMPLHDATGKIIGTVGMDFKADRGLQKPTVIERANTIVRELETRVPFQSKLLEPVTER